MPRALSTLLLCAAGTLLLALPAHARQEQPWLVGRGSADITGPALGLQLWGFGRPDQIGEGIHMRLRSRAFVIAERERPRQRVVLVTADLGSIDHHVTLEVVERLQQAFGDTYGLHNVLISATHTHAGPGGHWHSRTDTGLDGGLYPDHFEAIVAGITDSIDAAHHDMQPGSIHINHGRIADAGANRAMVAYLENPAQERARYSDTTNTRMTLLKFSTDAGDIGLLNWYALHPTAMNFYNRLISGDHKGYAAQQLERALAAEASAGGNFVAAFAQADPGDVTPNTNLDNTGPGATDVETTQIMGERQLAVARTLLESAQEALHGRIETRQLYFDMSDIAVQDRFTGAGVQRTCPSAYGYSFAGGSTEDGGAHFLFEEGMTKQKWWLDILIRLVTGAPRWTEAVKACQAPKPILFETGSPQPPLQSQIHSMSVARIGQLVLLAVPTEVTTMAGRRLRDTVRGALGEAAAHVVLQGYTNGFKGYITTPEEYALQQYEGGHTLHGPWSLDAYRQTADALVRHLIEGEPAGASVAYDDWRGKSPGLPLPGSDIAARALDPPAGSALPLPRDSYRAGTTASVEFWSEHPGAHFVTGNNFLLVEQRAGNTWRALADDSDWGTRVRWRTRGERHIAELSWDIPATATAGDYRLRHLGFEADGTAFSGASATFGVDAP